MLVLKKHYHIILLFLQQTKTLLVEKNEKIYSMQDWLKTILSLSYNLCIGIVYKAITLLLLQISHKSFAKISRCL